MPAIPSHSFWIQSLEILSSKLQSLTSILLRSQNAGHKPQSNQCFFIPTARWSCFLQKRSIFGNTKIFISLPFNWELLFSAVERVRSVWSVQRFLPVPASLPSPHPLHTHIPHCIQDISENNFLNCWRFSAFPIQDVYGRRNVFPNTSLSSKMSDEKI